MSDNSLLIYMAEGAHTKLNRYAFTLSHLTRHGYGDVTNPAYAWFGRPNQYETIDATPSPNNDGITYIHGLSNASAEHDKAILEPFRMGNLMDNPNRVVTAATVLNTYKAHSSRGTAGICYDDSYATVYADFNALADPLPWLNPVDSSVGDRYKARFLFTVCMSASWYGRCVLETQAIRDKVFREYGYPCVEVSATPLRRLDPSEFELRERQGTDGYGKEMPGFYTVEVFADPNAADAYGHTAAMGFLRSDYQHITEEPRFPGNTACVHNGVQYEYAQDIPRFYIVSPNQSSMWTLYFHTGGICTENYERPYWTWGSVARAKSPEALLKRIPEFLIRAGMSAREEADSWDVDCKAARIYHRALSREYYPMYRTCLKGEAYEALRGAAFDSCSTARLKWLNDHFRGRLFHVLTTPFGLGLAKCQTYDQYKQFIKQYQSSNGLKKLLKDALPVGCAYQDLA